MPAPRVRGSTSGTGTASGRERTPSRPRAVRLRRPELAHQHIVDNARQPAVLSGAPARRRRRGAKLGSCARPTRAALHSAHAMPPHE